MVKDKTYLHQQTFSQSLEMCSANQPYTHFFLPELNADRTTQKIVQAELNAPYCLDLRASNKCRPYYNKYRPYSLEIRAKNKLFNPSISVL